MPQERWHGGRGVKVIQGIWVEVGSLLPSPPGLCQDIRGNESLQPRLEGRGWEGWASALRGCAGLVCQRGERHPCPYRVCSLPGETRTYAGKGVEDGCV